jgi:hypothetical protein
MIQRSTKTLLLGLVSLLFQPEVAIGGAITLTNENFETVTDGKSVFIKVSSIYW